MKFKKMALIISILMVNQSLAGTLVFAKDNNEATVITEQKRSKEWLRKDNDEIYDNGVGLTPQMGWSSWNFFKEKINEEDILAMADAIEKSGLVDLGYEYLNLDDCWQSSMRDENGKLQPDLTNFPSGMKELVRKVNEKGMKLGVYTSNGTFTCEDLPASLGNEKIDAETFAEWGIEYFKYDFCHNIPLPTEAPEIDRLYIGKKGEKDSIIIEAEDAKLYGNARIVNASNSYGGKYVTGLNANGGYIEFENINVEEGGEYVLTIGLKKSGNFEKYAQVLVNDENIYEAMVPPTSAWNPTGRHQLIVDLKAGSNKVKISNPIATGKDSAIVLYNRMGQELKKATRAQSEKTGEDEKPIFFSICEWGNNNPWEWGKGIGNSWRTTPDISANWGRIMDIYNKNIQLYDYAGPGHFNDPDMLEVGNGNLTYEENKSHFTLWCMMASPLILGNDIRAFINEDGTVDTDNQTYQIITNKDLIDIDQDVRGIQGRKYKTDGNVDIIVKPLENNELAICFFNKSNSVVSSSISINKLTNEDYIDLPKASAYKTYDLWDKTTERITDQINVTIPAHGVEVFRVSEAAIGEVDKEQSIILNFENILPTDDQVIISTEIQNTGKETMKNINASLEVPEGFTIEEIDVESESLATGETFVSKWRVSTPKEKGDFAIKTNVLFEYDSEESKFERETTKSFKTMNKPADGEKLGDIDWIISTAGWGGEAKRNKNIKNGPIVINEKTYTSGLGTHANGETQIFLGGDSYNFTSIIGIDDETKGGSDQWGRPSATFEVWADNEKIYDSGKIGYKDEKTVNLDIHGAQILTLKVTDYDDGNAYDECNWANGVFSVIDEQEVDKSVLKNKIEEARELLNAAIEGIENGQYHLGAKGILEEELKSAEVVLENKLSTKDDVELALINLEKSINKFNSLIITVETDDLNKNGKIDSGDLAIVSKNYGKSLGYESFNELADVNKDGKVDLLDLDFVTKRILK